MIHTARTRSVLLILLTLLAMVGVSACVAVPTSGPIETVGGEQPDCQNCVNVEVEPPSADDDRVQILEGYLRATSNFQPNYATARQFLSKAAQETWSPEVSATIYQDAKSVADGDQVKFASTWTGVLDKDRTYEAHDENFKWTFRFVREGGIWRINNPPPGLLVAAHSFESFYKPYDLFFLAKNGGSLVPESIYLPALRRPQNVASALINELLDGASDWLRPLVTTLPGAIALSVNSVTITDGVADVPLNDNVLALSDTDRSQLAAQVVYTLKQAGLGIKGVSFTVNQSKFRIPEADPNSQVMSVDAVPRELEPVPVVAGDQLYAVKNGKVVAVQNSSGTPPLSEVDNELGKGPYRFRSVAVSVADTDLAAVTDDGRQLFVAPTKGGKAVPVLSGKRNLLRPQFTRYGNLWVIGSEGGRQRVWLFEGKQQQAREVEAPALKGSTITAFKISPDGVRMALIRKTDDGDQLGLARINRGDELAIDRWQPLNTTREASEQQIDRMVDLAWIDATDLIVLGVPKIEGNDAAVAPFRISDDASRILSEGESDRWNAEEIAVQQRTQTIIIRGRGNGTWRDAGNSWLPFVEGLQAIAYPG